MKAILTSQGTLRLGVALVVVLGLLGGGFAVIHHGVDKATAGVSEPPDSDEPAEAEIPVKIVRPRYDKEFTMTEKRPADVLPYFETDLVTRVPGYIEWMPYDVGSRVKAGEVLVRVAVPDLVARRDQRQAEVKHAESVVEQKKASVKVARATWAAAKSRINAAKSREKADRAYLAYRDKQTKRYEGLLRDQAIEARLVDEQEDERHAAFEAVNADVEKVISATEDANAAEAHIDQAIEEQHEAEAKVKVAKAELDFAQAMLDYATIEAPYDGVIVHRNVKVNPGFFVQNAGNGHAVPLLTIHRNDIVTVVMRLPDNFAAYVTPQTEAIFETPSLPGVKIRGKVTRYPPSLVTPEKDRTMLVEVDLWNRSPQRVKEKLSDKKFIDGLKKGMPGDPRGGLPVLPNIEGNLAGREILPGMFGEMTLVLHKFENVYMLPSQAVINKGGNQYIYVVKDGKAQLQRVKEQVNDGKLVYVELLDKEGTVLGDLTGKEEVIISNQGELSEGQPVKPSIVDDWKGLVPGGDRNEKR
ncbi:MAG TPA: HlyD family efflux transporter periplasmic adaptor subunit [Gemmataceae bacterium]|jgi:multidrug resistance efflux pump